MTRTLVVHVGGIGDFLLACPAVDRLGRDGPVELLGRKERLQLAVEGGIATAAHDMDAVSFDSAFASAGPAPALLDFLARFDRAVVFMRSGDELRRVFADAVGDVAMHPGLPPQDWTRHASRYYLQCVGAYEAPPLRLDIQPAGEPLDVVIHPGSGGRNKNWPLEHFLKLADGLRQEGRQVTWCKGPAEDDLPIPGPVLPPVPLVDLARRLANTRQYVGNDSGITHLAAAVGCPTLAIFGPTDPEVWAPRGNHVRVAGWDAKPLDLVSHIFSK